MNTFWGSTFWVQGLLAVTRAKPRPCGAGTRADTMGRGMGRRWQGAPSAQFKPQTPANTAEARPRAQEPRQSPAAGERQETAKLELCSLGHPSPGALFSTPPLT